MSKIKILDTNKSLHDTAKAMFDKVLEMQTDADRQVRSMRDVESKIVTIEKTRQEHEEQRKKQEQEQRLAEEQREREEASRKAREAAAEAAAAKKAAEQLASAQAAAAALSTAPSPAAAVAPQEVSAASPAPQRPATPASGAPVAAATPAPEKPAALSSQKIETPKGASAPQKTEAPVPTVPVKPAAAAPAAGTQNQRPAPAQQEPPAAKAPAQAQPAPPAAKAPTQAQPAPPAAKAPAQAQPARPAAKAPAQAQPARPAAKAPAQQPDSAPQAAQKAGPTSTAGKQQVSAAGAPRSQQSQQPRQGQQRPAGSQQPRQGQQRPAGGQQPRQGQQRQQGQRPAASSGQRGQQRPGQGAPQPDARRQQGRPAPAANAAPGSDHARKKRDDSADRKKKKPVIKERVFSQEYDDNPRGSRKRGGKKAQKRTPIEPIRIDHAVITEETVSVKVLSEKIGKPVSEILKKLLLLGMMSNINSQIDFDTAELVASEFGITLEQKVGKTAEEMLVEESAEVDDDAKLRPRPPVVTIMGHVDHGKTSLLDKIRKTHVTDAEAGGITQHIGAYQVELNGRKITFIDTPGHEAFTAMRARGAQVTDIAIIVVAADDGIMPQTVEAINHAKAADVPIIVAVNKIDRENAKPDKVTQELTEHDLVPEQWGGDTIVVPVSAKTGQGIDQLLESIILVADMEELKANPDRNAKGTIIEAQLDKGRGPVATVLVQNGTLKTGDTIIAGTAFGRVRAMVDDRGRTVKEALPSQPVEVIGFSEVPVAGDLLNAADGNLSKKVVEERRNQQKAEQLKKRQSTSLEDLFSQISEGTVKDLNIVIKADVQGSVEAVRESLEKLSNDEVRVRAIHAGVGAITESDVMLASAANAIIIGFNVRPDGMATAAAEREQIDVRLYKIIYKAIEDVEKAMRGMLEPEYEEVVTGHAEVRQIFKSSSAGTIAGCYVQNGVIRRNSQIRLLRDGKDIYDGTLSSLKRFKDDVREVAAGFECGTSIENYNDIKEGDVIECYEMREVER